MHKWFLEGPWEWVVLEFEGQEASAVWEVLQDLILIPRTQEKAGSVISGQGKEMGGSLESSGGTKS